MPTLEQSKAATAHMVVFNGVQWHPDDLPPGVSVDDCEPLHEWFKNQRDRLASERANVHEAGRATEKARQAAKAAEDKERADAATDLAETKAAALAANDAANNPPLKSPTARKKAATKAKAD